MEYAPLESVVVCSGHARHAATERRDLAGRAGSLKDPTSHMVARPALHHEPAGQSRSPVRRSGIAETGVEMRPNCTTVGLVLPSPGHGLEVPAHTVRDARCPTRCCKCRRCKVEARHSPPCNSAQVGKHPLARWLRRMQTPPGTCLSTTGQTAMPEKKNSHKHPQGMRTGSPHS
eukprot:7383548-Prymnesium_polylepis.3